jgi:tetratricopeptide (TPR) repeat protein
MRLGSVDSGRASLVRPLALAALFLGVAVAWGAEATYQTADEAFGVGAAHYNARNFAASRAPFEAALKLAPDDAYRVKVYEALLASYRQEGSPDKMVEACEFIIGHTDQAAKQSITRQQLLGFLQERGKVDEYSARLEAALQQDPKHRLSLYLLSEIYAQTKRDPQRAAAMTERLAALDQASGKPRDVQQTAQLAQQYVKAGKPAEGAALYEQIAAQDPALAAWHWKEAALAWLAAGQKEKALLAARNSAVAKPEARNDLLAHFWHRGLGDVFLKTGEPKLAIPHYEAAIGKTTIDGYRKDCQKSLDEARALAGQ